jgi:hypothetical protein
MDKRQTIGLAGVAALAIGVFVPLVSLPIVGSLTYFNNGKGDGIIVLALAVISALIVLAKRYRALADRVGHSGTDRLQLREHHAGARRP